MKLFNSIFSQVYFICHPGWCYQKLIEMRMYIPDLVEVMNAFTKWGLSDKNWYPLSVPPAK